MNNTEFWTMYEARTLTIDDRIALIRSTNYDVSKETQPMALLQYFECITYSDTAYEDAIKIANVFNARFGLLIISLESSYCLNKFQTIMDELDFEMESSGAFWIGILRLAFRKMGFMYAEDIHSMHLFRMYHPLYGNTFGDGTMAVLDDFVKLPKEFEKELVEYMFHPIRISRWMKSNSDKDIEDYLN